MVQDCEVENIEISSSDSESDDVIEETKSIQNPTVIRKHTLNKHIEQLKNQNRHSFVTTN